MKQHQITHKFRDYEQDSSRSRRRRSQEVDRDLAAQIQLLENEEPERDEFEFKFNDLEEAAVPPPKSPRGLKKKNGKAGKGRTRITTGAAKFKDEHSQGRSSYKCPIESCTSVLSTYHSYRRHLIYSHGTNISELRTQSRREDQSNEMEKSAQAPPRSEHLEDPAAAGNTTALSYGYGDQSYGYGYGCWNGYGSMQHQYPTLDPSGQWYWDYQHQQWFPYYGSQWIPNYHHYQHQGHRPQPAELRVERVPNAFQLRSPAREGGGGGEEKQEQTRREPLRQTDRDFNFQDILDLDASGNN